MTKLYRVKVKCLVTKYYEYFKTVEVEADSEDEAYDNTYITAKELEESDIWINENLKYVSEDTEFDVEKIDEI